MKLSSDVVEILQAAVEYASQYGYEFVTPELLLLEICDTEAFTSAFEQCGGDTKKLESDLEQFLDSYMEVISGEEPTLSYGVSQVLARAWEQAMNSGRDEVELIHLFHAIVTLPESHAAYYFASREIELSEVLGAMSDGESTSEVREELSFMPCLNDTLTDVNPLIGRRDELERTMEILCRRDKNNPLFIGEPGVGKTAIVYGLVMMIREGRVPEPLRKAKVFLLDLGSMLAGTQYRGDFERRLKSALERAGQEEFPIIFIDEIHNLSGTGAIGESSFDAGNLLKPYLSQGRIRFIGATTFDENKKYFEKNRSLVRRFQNVEIPEPSIEETLRILEGLKDKYEEYHGVTYDEGVIEYAVKMSDKHINERFLPDKAIDLIDEAGAYVKLHAGDLAAGSSEAGFSVADGKELTGDLKSDGKELPGDSAAFGGAVSVDPAAGGKEFLPDSAAGSSEAGPSAGGKRNPGSLAVVDKDVINRVLTNICRVPIEAVDTEDTEKLETLESRMKAKIFGQEEAVARVVNAVKFSKAGLSDGNKPLASLLFVGPTGVGKTEVARTLARELGVKLVRFDMSEYEEKHAVSKLIGAPAGYVGYEEGGLLTGEIRKNPSCVLLLDEIEKAHFDIFNVLLQVMDYATLTDNQGRKADFRNVILIMTSNAGANRLGKQGIGFSAGIRDEGALMEEVKRTFTPEFRNRLNKTVVFNSMDGEMAERIIDKKLGELSDMLRTKNIRIKYDKKAKKLLLKRGVTREYGAREIDRVISNEIKPLFVDEILFGSLKNGGELTLTAGEDRFGIRNCKP